jgi:hypothetical protein
LTGYRLLTTIVIMGVGIPKAVYSYYGQSLISPTLDWLGGILFTLLLVFISDIGFTEFVDLMVLRLFWLGVIEATRPELCPSFFQVDLAPTILRSMDRDGTSRPLSGSVSHHPTSPIPSTPIPAGYPSTNSRDPPSPVTQHAVTRPVPVHPNTAPSVPDRDPTHPIVVIEGGPPPITQSRRHGACISSVYAEVVLIMHNGRSTAEVEQTQLSRDEFIGDLGWSLSSSMQPREPPSVLDMFRPREYLA